MLCTIRAAVVNLNFRSGSTFPVPVCTAPHRHWVKKRRHSTGLAGVIRFDAVRLHIGWFTFTKGAEVFVPLILPSTPPHPRSSPHHHSTYSPSCFHLTPLISSSTPHYHYSFYLFYKKYWSSVSYIKRG